MSTAIVPQIDTAATVYDAAYALRNKLLANYDTREAAGSLTLIITTWAVLTTAQARREAARFASIARAAIFDEMLVVVDYARRTAPAGAWYRAVERAYGWLLDQDVLRHRPADHALLVESASTPGTFYAANGSCGCRAHELGNPCWHRCAARIVTRALELHARTRAIATEAEVSLEGARVAAAHELGMPIYRPARAA